ncbi:MAG: winged helix-turn-helix transcriptional regulator [Lachnospiraceae bacterium]|nr:winged helix-turn-helix transcriptional regulator [Lachnospiraceae bacterium]MBR2755652.1 winged helix-turn-helix transcriptional regulator [Lachnospiraceae bacterium]MBR2841971.1 winged helix-turn-helix transcriptional regulator [Lachnospiraceae bacterium]MBR3262504.1 winged helix-turn-helix transcriptional regulator [Lachnospiraceae bacterium]MBR3360836.1 winged helix-turn-helix transcriptional regulator [Lachnospiraceae bacterium]
MDSLRLPHEHGESDQVKELIEQLSEIDKYQAIAEIFKHLDDANRIRIFYLLCNCEECVINISAILGISSPAASHHLRLLKDRQLIVSRRSGKEVYYKASDTEESLLLQKLLRITFENILSESDH